MCVFMCGAKMTQGKGNPWHEARTVVVVVFTLLLWLMPEILGQTLLKATIWFPIICRKGSDNVEELGSQMCLNIISVF